MKGTGAQPPQQGAMGAQSQPSGQIMNNIAQ